MTEDRLKKAREVIQVSERQAKKDARVTLKCLKAEFNI
jgi:hypothetical protein